MLRKDFSISIITAFANDKDDYLDMLEEESSYIDALIKRKRGNVPSSLEHIHIPQATLSEIVDGFIEGNEEVGIFHFAGHAKKTLLRFEDSLANADGLAHLMKSQNCIPLVFLNGCSTHQQIQYFKDAGVGAIISTYIDIQDNVAVKFSKRFYDSLLGQKRTIEESFDDAVNLIQLEERKSKVQPVFQKKRKIRDDISIEVTEVTNHQLPPWTLEAFDNTVLSLNIDEIGSYIQRRKLIKPYADWLVSQHSTLKIGGLRGSSEIDLDRVFVSLKGELSKTYEIIQSQKQLKEDVEALERKFSEQNISRQEQQRQKSKLLGRSAVMPTIEERDNRSKNKYYAGQELNLVEAIEQFDKLVILGDPGTGKTTLARWLVLMLAKKMSENQHAENLSISANRFKVQNEFELIDETAELDFLRLPILIRVSEYADRIKDNPLLRLEDFFGHHSWLGSQPYYCNDESGGRSYEPIDPDMLNVLLLDYIKKGEALIILDGLDEVIQERERQQIVKNIELFIEEYIDSAPVTENSRRNKIVVTSRIAGYHSNALDNDDLYHVTIQPMRPHAIRHFSKTWMLATQKQIQGGQVKELELEYKSNKLSQKLNNLIFDPNKPGLMELASNPLLLTELGKIFLVEDLKLPETRVELYEKTARNMLDIWRNKRGSRYEDKIDVFEEKIFYVLEDIAAYVHENYPTGLIDKTEISALIGKSLDQFRIDNPQLGRELTLKQEKDELLKALDEEVGILAARGTDLYGFLHLTFEEFFAAKKILRYPDTLIDEILPKAYQPRWREPLLLAISYLGKKMPFEKDRKEALRRLLDAKDPMGNIIPRSANLIALAIPEMNYVPDSGLVHDMVLHLLNAYRSAGPLEEGLELRENVEGTFSVLKKNKKVWQSILISIRAIIAGENTDDELKCASAKLIYNIKATDANLIESYTKALSKDLSEWNWPIHHLVVDASKSNPQWVSYSNLPMRQYLFEYPDMLEVVNKDPDWISIFVLLYGGLSNKKSEEKLFNISYETIVSDSFLTEKLIDLLEDETSPSSLLAFCTEYWKDDKNKLERRVDSFLVSVFVGKNVSLLYAHLQNATESPLSLGVKNRINKALSLHSSVLSGMLRKAHETLEQTFKNKNDSEALLFISALFKLDQYFNEKIGNPVVWVNAAPQVLRPLVLAEIWIQPFSSDDPAYNMAVVLDTLGSQIEKLGTEVIVKSFALIQRVSVLPPSQMWRIERIPYNPVTEEELLELALVNLQTLNSDFDCLKIWAIGQFNEWLGLYPDLKQHAYLLVANLKGRSSIKMGRKNIGIVDKDDDPDDAQLADEEQVYYPSGEGFYTLINIQRLHYPEINLVDISTHINKLPPAARLSIIFNLLSNQLRGHGFQSLQRIEGYELLLNQAENAIEQLIDPRYRITTLLKLATYFLERSQQNTIIGNAILVLDQIEDQIVLAQFLRDIRPWTVESPVLISKWENARNRLDDELSITALTGRLSPHFKNITSTEETNLPLHFTTLSALLYDLNQVFSLPDDVEDLWELIHDTNAEVREKICDKIYAKGVKNRIKLSLRGALAITSLLSSEREELVIRLIPCIEQPDPEAIPVVSKWLFYEKSLETQVFAALLLLEVKFLSKKTFLLLEKVLFGSAFSFQDQIRNRINLALNTPYFYTSMLGLDTLLEIAKSISQNFNDRPYLIKGLSWFYEYLIFDSPEIVNELVLLAKGKGRKANYALSTLSRIQFINHKNLESYISGLRSDHRIVRKCFFKSTIYVVNKYYQFNYRPATLKEIREELLIGARLEDKDARYYAVEAMGYLSSLSETERALLIELVEKEEDQTSYLALVALGRADYKASYKFIKEKFDGKNSVLRGAAIEAITRNLIEGQGAKKSVFSRLEVKYSLDAPAILEALLLASKDRWWGKYSKKCLEIMGLFFEEHPSLYAKFAATADQFLPLPESLRQDYSYLRDVRWMTRAFRIDALAAGAEKLPATFSRNANLVLKIEDYLADIVQKDGVFVSRMSALTCLSLLRKMSRPCAISFTKALKDISEVQTRVTNVLFRFWEIETTFIQEVSSQMDRESYSSRYAIINMLAYIGVYAKTNADLRAEILEILLLKLNDPAYKVPVYLLRKKINRSVTKDGTVNEIDEGNTIDYLGRLDSIIYRKILNVAGVGSSETSVD